MISTSPQEGTMLKASVKVTKLVAALIIGTFVSGCAVTDDGMVKFMGFKAEGKPYCRSAFGAGDRGMVCQLTFPFPLF
jgi:hypothetical protein